MVAANSWEEMFNNAALREQYKHALYFLQTLSIE
jgi:hypothetical protein